MKIVIAGATGLVGRPLSAALQQAGFDFRYPEIGPALPQVLGGERAERPALHAAEAARIGAERRQPGGRRGGALMVALDSSSSASPFAAVWGEGAASLAPALREQYLLRADAPHDVVMTGTVERVWQRPAWLLPFFWALEWSRVLFAATGRDVPATLRVSVARDAAGGVRHVWRRTMHFARPRRFDAVLEYDAARRRVVERVGIAGFLEVVWDIQPVSPRAIAIRTEGMALRVGRRTLPLPRVLCVEVRALEEADPDRDDTVRLDLWMTHPLLGPVFGYRGTFAAKRVLREHTGGAEAGERVGAHTISAAPPADA